jgi:tetratricopeptide (TPR) repeat protein
MLHDLGDRRDLPDALAGLGKALQRQGNLGQANELFEESLAVGRSTGDHESIAQALFLLANLHWLRGDLSAAQTMVREALVLYDAIDDARRVATCVEAAALLAAARGDEVRAARLCGAASGLFAQVGVPIPRHDRFDRAEAVMPSWEEEGTAGAAGWAAGRALSLQQAVAEALQATGG